MDRVNLIIIGSKHVQTLVMLVFFRLIFLFLDTLSAEKPHHVEYCYDPEATRKEEGPAPDPPSAQGKGGKEDIEDTFGKRAVHKTQILVNQFLTNHREINQQSEEEVVADKDETSNGPIVWVSEEYQKDSLGHKARREDGVEPEYDGIE